MLEKNGQAPHVLDTEHFTLYRYGHASIKQRVEAVPADLLSITIITIEEQLSGLWGIRRRRKGSPRLSWHLAGIALTFAWFTTFVVASMTLCGGNETCTFGSEMIRYHQTHGSVLGLEDARAGGGGLFFLLLAIFFVPFLALEGIRRLRQIYRCRLKGSATQSSRAVRGEGQ